MREIFYNIWQDLKKTNSRNSSTIINLIKLFSFRMYFWFWIISHINRNHEDTMTSETWNMNFSLSLLQIPCYKNKWLIFSFWILDGNRYKADVEYILELMMTSISWDKSIGGVWRDTSGKNISDMCDSGAWSISVPKVNCIIYEETCMGRVGRCGMRLKQIKILKFSGSRNHVKQIG